MAFADELKVHFRAGRGGNGVVRWRHEKNKEKGGPSGGDGGKGGDFYARAIRDIGILGRYRGLKEFRAEIGESGKANDMRGAGGDDYFFDVPVGSLIKNHSTGEEFDLIKEDQKVMLLAGGKGGLGNAHFKSSSNQTPEEWTVGENGEEADFSIELRLIADVGLVGLPNAGKSSLLNVLTRAQARIGSYEFTTLEPNLGALHGHILADIPGLIEGASQGKGLGHKFLRHIKRTRILVHCVSLEVENPQEAYQTVRAELEEYDQELAKKKEILVLTKSDTVDEKHKETVLTWAKNDFDDVFVISIYDDAAIKAFSDALISLLTSLPD